MATPTSLGGAAGCDNTELGEAKVGWVSTSAADASPFSYQATAEKNDGPRQSGRDESSQAAREKLVMYKYDEERELEGRLPRGSAKWRSPDGLKNARRWLHLELGRGAENFSAHDRSHLASSCPRWDPRGTECGCGCDADAEAAAECRVASWRMSGAPRSNDAMNNPGCCKAASNEQCRSAHPTIQLIDYVEWSADGSELLRFPLQSSVEFEGAGWRPSPHISASQPSGLSPRESVYKTRGCGT